ncbi:DUF342 domain-containing protein [Spirochaeta isovalerica]|uniref:Flagellar Assembly Protein A N-terminal region domain-containing protein n=1 Tax=Spirochaeta isovalerica TaxID=150 RepID=A0A841RIC6_9SPIO|nr:FapA family protein [Spirochaeta isovalerica]MBB6482499.1 hypothetical protein [Spirochaeta isovalerica]
MSEKIIDDRSDGYVAIEISEDKMEAFASFFPATGKGRPLEKVQADSALNANNISYGIIDENILKAIEQCNSEQKAVKNVPIAKGTKPVKASPPHINLKPEFFNREKTVVRADGSVDHKESSPFVMVKKGEAVGRIFPYRAGVEGKDVTGAAVPFKNKDMQIFKAGENLEPRGELLVSMAHGRFVIEGDNISVTEVLEIPSDVDYHTGNVSFAGDLIIEGGVQDGFRVAAGKSIRCKQLVKNAEVLCRGDLNLDLGVKGRGNALIRANGMVTAKFIEYGTVESRSGITVSTSIMSADINTLGKLSMGQKGIIVSSTIMAEKAIEAYNIGRENCAPSILWCGVSFVENRKLENMKVRHEVLLEKIQKMKNRPNPPEELISRMEEASGMQEKEIETLAKNLCACDEAYIKVHGTLFAGTEIRVGHLKLKVESDQTRVLVKMDKEKGQIIMGPIL